LVNLAFSDSYAASVETFGKDNQAPIFNLIKDEMLQIKIHGFQFYKNQATNGRVEFSNLQGTDVWKILNSFNVNILYSTNPVKCEKVKTLWSLFTSIMSSLNNSTITTEEMRMQGKKFLNLFLGKNLNNESNINNNNSQNVSALSLLQENTEDTLYTTAEVTPYIHIFAFHLSEFLQNHQNNIKQYTCEILEKKNHLHATYFNTSTQRNPETGCKQLAEHDNRQLISLLRKKSEEKSQNILSKFVKRQNVH
jgi:hypothetical protein